MHAERATSKLNILELRYKKQKVEFLLLTMDYQLGTTALYIDTITDSFIDQKIDRSF